MSYLDFDALIRELAHLSKTPVPCYQVIKDMFDAVDSRHDFVIDQQEWNSAFGSILSTGPKVSVKPTNLTFWESSSEAVKIGTCIARNRKLLLEAFKQNSTHSNYKGEAQFVTF